MKCRSSTSLRMMSKNASSSLCSTIFLGDFFVAFEGRHLSNSSVTEVSEVNVMFSNLTEPVKENSGENLQQVLLITLNHIWKDHEKINHRREDQP